MSLHQWFKNGSTFRRTWKPRWICWRNLTELHQSRLGDLIRMEGSEIWWWLDWWTGTEQQQQQQQRNMMKHLIKFYKPFSWGHCWSPTGHWLFEKRVLHIVWRGTTSLTDIHGWSHWDLSKVAGLGKLPELTLWLVGGGPGLYLSLIVGKSYCCKF